jgi:hypothetical protein
MLINFSGGCQAPKTVTVEAITGTMGLYDLAVWEHDSRWHWAVSIQDALSAQGRTRSQAAAMAAAEKAVRRFSAPRRHR